jgi:hypothetical protein
MNIVGASYNEFGGINVVVEDMPESMSITVPADPANKDYVELQEWAAKEGNEIAQYEPPLTEIDTGGGGSAVVTDAVTREEFDALEARVAALESK